MPCPCWLPSTWAPMDSRSGNSAPRSLLPGTTALSASQSPQNLVAVSCHLWLLAACAPLLPPVPAAWQFPPPHPLFLPLFHLRPTVHGSPTSLLLHILPAASLPLFHWCPTFCCSPLSSYFTSRSISSQPSSILMLLQTRNGSHALLPGARVSAPDYGLLIQPKQ